MHHLSSFYTLLLISPPADETNTMIQRLTEIFGGAPGPRLALAQGEAALSAQETPHPCPACGRARSSQRPFTPGLEVDAATECPLTPSRCSSPELTASKSLYPASQIKRAQKVTFAGFLGASFSQSENQRSGAEERKAGGKGRASECQALHPGWGGPASASVQTLWLSDYQETGTRSLGPEMVLCKKRYCEAPFFYKYLSHSLSLSHPHSLSSSVAHVDGAPLRGLGTDPETVWCTSQGHFSDYSGCVNLSTGAPVTEMEPADTLKVTSNAAVSQLRQTRRKLAEDYKYQSDTRQTAWLGSSACRSERTLWCAQVPEEAGAVDAVFYLAGVCVCVCVCAFRAAGIPMMRWWMTFTLLPHTSKKKEKNKEKKWNRAETLE